MPERMTWTAAEVAQVIGISKNAVYDAVERNRIPHVRLGRRVLFPKQPVLDWLNKVETGGTSPSSPGVAEAPVSLIHGGAA